MAAPAAAASLTPPLLSHATSFYSYMPSRRRHVILFIVSIASILVPFCDTIYLPALQVMGQHGFRTTAHPLLCRHRRQSKMTLVLHRLEWPHLLPSTCLPSVWAR